MSGADVFASLTPTASGAYLLDGSIGVELGRRGVDLTDALWSAGANLAHPDLVEQVHRDYLNAGAQIITTNTFRAHRRALPGGSDARLIDEIVAAGIAAARRARDAVNPGAIIAGSIGPLEDCYATGRAPDEATGRREHGEQIERMLGCGADVVLFETIGTHREAVAAAREASRRAEGRWMLSMIAQHDRAGDLLLGGESIKHLITAISDDLERAAAVGLNCVGAPAMAAGVAAVRACSPQAVRVLASANVGMLDVDGRWRQTDALDPKHYAAYAESWIEAGATVIGGCCGTTSATITALADRL